jgi:phage baseplate assembly protein W
MSIKIESLSNLVNVANLKYQDLKLDLEYTYTQNPEFSKVNEIKDLRVDFDINAIKNSLRNLFLTNRGEKLLNPYFGIGLGNYVFSQVTEGTAIEIGNQILQNIKLFEPRVEVSNINVVSDPEDNSYSINLSLTIPQLKGALLNLIGKLNNTGFAFL